MRRSTSRKFVCDFETTVYADQTDTEVWASCSCELGTEEAHVFHSIDQQMLYFFDLHENLIVYFHNLKFDGAFILSYLMLSGGYKQGGKPEYDDDGNLIGYEWKTDRDLRNNEYKYSISDMGQWYSLTIRVDGKLIQFSDSLKLLPFSVAQIGPAFNTKHRKLDIEYTGYRYAGCVITPEEQEYIKNDVYVVKEALETMFAQGHDKLTIGSCCLSEYKSITGGKAYTELFPNLVDIPLSIKDYGSSNADAYVRRAYRGAWCYLVNGKENQVKENGITLDVNSLYPSVMHSSSLNAYPVGEPHFWKGNYIPDETRGKYYFMRVRTRFYLKPGKLPCIQIKNDLRYRVNAQLETSDVWDSRTGQYYAYTKDRHGNINPCRPEMTWSITDFQLIRDHYDLVDFEILDGCWFNTAVGIFDRYIDKWGKVKETSTGAMRSLAKLFLNNLYGKLATNTRSGFKVAYLKSDESIGFVNIEDNSKKPVYIAAGAAVTSYARNFTIRAAQENYYGNNAPGFIYADTDSLHIDIPVEKVRGVSIHNTHFNHWKHESSWDKAIFVRQKTYIEHTEEGYAITCAGMPQRCKDEFALQLESGEASLNDFKTGFQIGGKLMPKRIKGGIVLVETTFEIR